MSRDGIFYITTIYDCRFLSTFLEDSTNETDQIRSHSAYIALRCRCISHDQNKKEHSKN